MKKQNSKQRLFEVMGRLDKSFKPKLNEFDNYNYPAGADADPNAPWHREDSPSYDDWEVEKGNDGEPELVLHNTTGDKFILDWDFIYPDYEEFESIGELIYDAKSNPELSSKIEAGIDTYLSSNEIEWGLAEHQSSNDGVDDSSNNMLPITTPIGSDDDKLFSSVVNQGIDSHLEGFTKSKFTVQNNSLGKRRVYNFAKSELPILLRRLEELGTEEALGWMEDIEEYSSGNESHNSLNEVRISRKRKKSVKNESIVDRWVRRLGEGYYNESNQNIDPRENLEYFLSFNDDGLYDKWINDEISDGDAIEMMSTLNGITYNPETNYKEEY